MKKKIYEKPTIIRHVSGMANKFGRGEVRHSMPEIDGIPVADLISRYGTPLFVFSEEQLRRSYREMWKLFAVRYPRVQFAWSYKTNYLDAVCRVFHDEGAWAEVVSEAEYEMARRLGVQGDQIIFNGPYKPEAALRQALKDGARIHIDNFDELFLVEEIAAQMDLPVAVGIRINMDTGIQPAWDRFGFNLDTGEAWNAVRRMHLSGKIRLNGVHAHIGTFILSPLAYGTATTKLATFIKRVKDEMDFTVEYLDIGGGFPSSNTLHGQYAPGDVSNPPMENYAESITSALLAAGFEPADAPLLVLETGRALVDESGFLITRVISNKRLPTGNRSIVIDAGVNILFTSFWYKHNLYPVQDSHGMYEETVVYGPLCMNIDVIRPSVYLPALDTGAALVVHPVGAYNVTQWMQFIRMRPPVIMIGCNGKVACIRKAENIHVIKELESVPDWLA